MAPDDIQDMFSVFGPVDVRRMFGGAGVFADGLMIALIHDDVIYLKADENSAPTFEREGLGCFTYRRSGKQASLSSYRRMPDRLYDDRDELASWARQALQVARAKSTRRKKSRGSGRKSRK